MTSEGAARDGRFRRPRRRAGGRARLQTHHAQGDGASISTSRPTITPSFARAVKRLVKEGKLDLAKDKTLRRPDQAGMIVGLFRRSAKGFGFVRPHTSTSKIDHIYIPVEATRDASSGDEVAVKITKRSRREGMNVEGRIVEVLTRASGIFVGTYTSRPATPASSRSTARRFASRSRWAIPGQGGQARRQGRTRDRALSDAVSRRGRGHHRDPRPARPAGGRHVDASFAPSTFPILSTKRSSTRPANRPSCSTKTRSATRLDLRGLDNGDDRPGDRPRLRRCDLAVARRARPLDAGSPYRRRVALRSARIGA